MLTGGFHLLAISDLGPDSTQDLRPRRRLESNPEIQLMCKGPSFPAKIGKNGTSECRLDPSFCSRVETFLWEILELYKGLKESLEIPEIRCD